MYIKNRVDPRTEPCRTPDMTLHGVEYEPSTVTHCDLFALIQSSSFPLNCIVFKLCTSLECATLSKTLEKSNMPMST